MKKIIILSAFVFVVITQLALTPLHSNGIAGYNNSPGETTCTSCHVTYPLNSLGGSVEIKLPTCTNQMYVEGQAYTVNVKISKAGVSLFGFSFEALDSTGANAGILTLLDPNTTILINALINNNSRTNVTHYGGVLNTDSCIFSFTWTAPLTNVGKITFYAAANASNNDGVTYGDYIYTATQTLNPDLNTSVKFKINSENKIYLSPNPCNTDCYIDLNEADEFTLNLYDVSGKNVLSQRMKNKSFFDVSRLDEGIFTLAIKTDNRLFFKKLVIVH